MDFAKLVADTIGEVDSSLVKEVIDISNKETYIFHGIKGNESFSIINKEGVCPLTPEGGYVSFWASGKKIFGEILDEKLSTYDTPFFHYAHSNDSSEDFIFMNMAIAKYSDLEERSLVEKKFEEDGYLTISQTIPRNLIHLFRAELEVYKNKNVLRENSQIAERILLKQIHNALIENYSSGRITSEKSFIV